MSENKWIDQLSYLKGKFNTILCREGSLWPGSILPSEEDVNSTHQKIFSRNF